MERVRIAALFADKEQYGGASVTVCGWAKTIRDMKTFGFIELNDGSCFRNLQVVMDANSLSNYKEIAAQNVGAALIVRGTVVLTPEAKQFIIDAAYDPQFGARPLRRLIQRTVEDTLSEELLGGKIALGDRVRLKVADGKITVEKEA